MSVEVTIHTVSLAYDTHSYQASAMSTIWTAMHRHVEDDHEGQYSRH